jgi:hypothetical protein
MLQPSFVASSGNDWATLGCADDHYTARWRMRRWVPPTWLPTRGARSDRRQTLMQFIARQNALKLFEEVGRIVGAIDHSLHQPAPDTLFCIGPGGTAWKSVFVIDVRNAS